ncbi:MAG: hypothetical protein HQ564_07875 [Candidatus Saganbacteria bacterium]|nr:hypothetical protein [Candidatus Saganbacteria bacterium]
MKLKLISINLNEAIDQASAYRLFAIKTVEGLRLAGLPIAKPFINRALERDNFFDMWHAFIGPPPIEWVDSVEEAGLRASNRREILNEERTRPVPDWMVGLEDPTPLPPPPPPLSSTPTPIPAPVPGAFYNIPNADEIAAAQRNGARNAEPQSNMLSLFPDKAPFEGVKTVEELASLYIFKKGELMDKVNKRKDLLKGMMSSGTIFGAGFLFCLPTMTAFVQSVLGPISFALMVLSVPILSIPYIYYYTRPKSFDKKFAKHLALLTGVGEAKDILAKIGEASKEQRKNLLKILKKYHPPIYHDARDFSEFV